MLIMTSYFAVRSITNINLHRGSRLWVNLFIICLNYILFICLSCALFSGKKRAATYGSVINLVRLLVTISGTGIPLAIMSVLGFESSSGSDDDDSSSTPGATLAIRVWCTLCISVFFAMAYFFMLNYNITEEMHASMLGTITARDDAYNQILLTVGGAEEAAGDNAEAQSQVIRTPSNTPKDNTADTSATVTLFQVLQDVTEILPDDDVPAEERFSDDDRSGNALTSGTATVDTSKKRSVAPKPLDSVDDPLTGLPVSPPPFAQLTFICKKVVRGHAAVSATHLSGEEEIQLRLLCCYFPTVVELLTTDDGRKLLIRLFVAKTVFGTIFLLLGTWQSVFVLANADELGSYLCVVLTVLYSFFVSWQVLHSKGIKIPFRMAANGPVVSVLKHALAEMEQMQQPAAMLGSDERVKGKDHNIDPPMRQSLVSSHVEDCSLRGVQCNSSQLVRNTAIQLSIIVTTWVVAYVAVNV